MLFGRQFQPASRHQSARLSVEPLDDRVVPAALSVGDAVIYEPFPAGTIQYAEVRVSLDAPARKTVTVNYSTADGTTTAGTDYTTTSGQLTFAPGQTTKTVRVPVRGDTPTEGRETFLVNLSGAQRAQIGDAQGTVTIVDDVLRIGINDVSNYEGNSVFTFTVSLSSACDEVVTVNYATADGTAVADADYLATSGTLTFMPGETTKSITVYAFGYVDGWPWTFSESFFVNLSEASGNAVIADFQGVGTIVVDSEPPGEGP
jgi:Calx-beta domain